jgi:PKD repeat protein
MPEAAFSVSDSLGCSGNLNVAVQNNSLRATSYRWNWGDNSATNSFVNPTHLYNVQGQYQISLVVGDGTCFDTAYQMVRVAQKPVADFSADNLKTCDTARVQFTNLSQNAVQYLWTFSNGTVSADPTPYVAFAPSNTPYTVKLVALDAYGCRDSVQKANLITAIVPPAADFFISPSATITVPNYFFSFNNLTLNSTRYQYMWDLGESTFASTRDASHQYADTGNYPIRLIVLDTATNCSDTMIRIARIDGFPGWLYVPNAICPNCIQSNLRAFIPKGKGLKTYHLQVFTTWGELVFETKELDATGAPVKSWDGRYKGVPVQQDVYVWRIDAKFMNGSEWEGMLYPGEGQYRKTGTITVVR